MAAIGTDRLRASAPVRRSEREGVLDKSGKFDAVESEGADRRRRGGIAAAIVGLNPKELGELGCDIGPGSHVLRLLLAPNDAGPSVLINEFFKVQAMQRVKLLDPDDSRIGDFVFGAVLGEVVVDFTGAEDHALGFGRRGGVIDNFLK